MSRRVKEFVDVVDHLSIDDLIHKLTEIRDNLPSDADAELRLRGDEVFGRRLQITYFRDQTPEELDLESKYAAPDEGGEGIEDLRRQLDDVPFEKRKARDL